MREGLISHVILRVKEWKTWENFCGLNERAGYHGSVLTNEMARQVKNVLLQVLHSGQSKQHRSRSEWERRAEGQLELSGRLVEVEGNTRLQEDWLTE